MNLTIVMPTMLAVMPGRNTRMGSLRCNWCEVRWPDDDRFKECPQCRENTQHSFQESIDQVRAEDIAAKNTFGWWLWDTGKL